MLTVGSDHPLAALFRELVNRRMADDSHIRDAEVTRYVAGLLLRFTDARELYRLRDARGRRLEDVGEMLFKSDPLNRASSFLREREVRKHIGDYTMFLCGLFPEYVAGLPRRHGRIDSLLDYVRTGKESYRIVASFNLFEFEREAPLFRKLSDWFELCVFGLNRVREDLDRLQRDQSARWRRILLAPPEGAAQSDAD